MRYLLLFATVSVAACSTYSERVAATCARLGAPRGSADYWSCVQMQYANDSARQAGYDSMIGAGTSLMAQPPQTIVVVPWR